MDFPSDRDVRDQAGVVFCGTPVATSPPLNRGDAANGAPQAGDTAGAMLDDRVARLVQDDCTDPVEIARFVTRASTRPHHILLAVERCAPHALLAALVDALDPGMHRAPALALAWDIAVDRGDREEVRAMRRVFY